MDIQDLQDDRRSDLQFREITEKIIGCAFEVTNKLEPGFLKQLYEKALAIVPEHHARIINFLKATGV